MQFNGFESHALTWCWQPMLCCRLERHRAIDRFESNDGLEGVLRWSVCHYYEQCNCCWWVCRAGYDGVSRC